MAANDNHALHLATHSGWYRYERRGENWQQIDRALTYWQMSCIQVDPDDPKHLYIGTEHSGMFASKDGGKDWTRANPNVPCLTMSSMLAYSGKLMVGTMPAALGLSKSDITAALVSPPGHCEPEPVEMATCTPVLVVYAVGVVYTD